MSIFDKLFGRKQKTKAMTFNGYAVGGVPAYLPWENNSKAYQENDTVYTVVKRASMKAANVPLYAYKSKSDIRKYKSISTGNQTRQSLHRYFIERAKALDEVDTNSDLAKLLQNPNPMQGADAFYEGIFSFRILRGEAFIWLNRGGIEGGRVLEMYLIPPDLMALDPDPVDLYRVKQWLFQVNGAQLPIAVEDIIHWKSFNPEFDAVQRTHLRGFDPLKPMKRRVQQDNDSQDAAVAMFQNGGAKGVIFNEDYTSLTEVQESQMRGVIDRKLNNTQVKSAVAALQGKWGYLDIGKDSVDMDLIKSQDLTLSRIANALGVDADVFLSGQTFSNKEWSNRNMVLQLIMPLCNSLRDELNRKLVPAFKGQYFCDFDFSLVPELQEDLTKMSSVWNGLFDRGLLNGNEMRELTGFEKTTNPLHEMYMITGNYSPLEDITMQEDTVQDQQQDEDLSKYRDYE